jgi:hypothetical protein
MCRRIVRYFLYTPALDTRLRMLYAEYLFRQVNADLSRSAKSKMERLNRCYAEWMSFTL